MKLKTFISIIALLLLVGCGTKGKEIKVELNAANNSGIINVYPTTETKSGDNQTTSANKTDLKDLVKVPLTGDSLDTAADILENEITSRVIDNLGKATPITKPKVPVVEAEEEKVKTTWKYTKVYEMQEISHDRPFFRFGIPGEEFGPSILITDDNGNTFFVSDTSKNTGDKEQQYFFNGKGEVATFDGNASMFWYSTGSHSITVHFNGVK